MESPLNNLPHFMNCFTIRLAESFPGCPNLSGENHFSYIQKFTGMLQRRL